jgi:undecaprenyl diphosphate synthase
MQSALRSERSSGLHVALIMDGNGRWGVANGATRLDGHRAGAQALRQVVEAAPGLGIGTLTVYAFSADNWKRPEAEVAGLMGLFGAFLRREAARCARQGVRLSVIGRRDRLSPGLRDAVARAEALTANGRRLHLRVALDYSARQAIAQGETFAPGPDVDLLIRTGGEQRLSDFMLYECAYAELVFTDCLWPDFGPATLEQALGEFRTRDRRFGGLSVAPSATPAMPSFQAPAGLAFGPDGSLYAADSLAGKVWRIRASEAPTLAVAQALERPEIVRVDRAGHLYVLERSVWGPRVRRFGTEQAVLYTGPAVQHAVDMAVTPDGTVYLLVWDAAGRRLIRLERGNQVEVGRFDGAPGLAIATDAEGRLVVAHGALVGRLEGNGDWEAIAELPLPLAPSDGSGLALDARGRLIVAYADAGRVLRLDPATGLHEDLKGPRVPVYPAVNAEGALTVVDAHTRRIVFLAGQAFIGGEG